MATRRSKLGWQAATQFTGRTTEWRRVRALGAGTGGLTSCEALWMGVPIITWPQSQVVSRQTFAFLSAIGLAELAAASPLMDVAGFTRQLEQTLLGLYRDIEAQAHFPSLRGAQRRGNP